jgi:hypothetical protein
MSAWSVTDDAAMLDYGTVPVRALAQRLRRSIGKVYDRARTLGLTRKYRGGEPYGGTMKPKKTHVRYRSAITGRWVTEAYAKAHPATTVRHIIKGGV